MSDEGNAAYDVLVCGAGIAGLACARALQEVGLRVLVVDRQRAPLDIPKGEVLQPRALDILRGWGTEQLLRDAGAVQLRTLAVREADGTPLLTMDYRQLPEGKQQLLAHDHLAILAALAEGLGQGVELRRGALVRDVLRDGAGRIIGLCLEQTGTRREVYAPLVVAADGLSSRLRRAAGIQGRRTDYPHRLVSLDIPDSPWFPEDFSAYVTGRGVRLVYPLPGRRLRMYLQVRPDELRGADRDQLTHWALRAVTEIPALRDLAPSLPTAVEQRQIFNVARFRAERLVAPGLALVGEAACAVHPMAAQGMTHALTSAVALAGQIGRRLVCRSRGATPARRVSTPRLDAAVVDAALVAYQTERLSYLAGAEKISASAAHMVTDLSLPARILGRRAMRRTGANPRLLQTVTHNLAGVSPRPLTVFDRMQQIGLLPGPKAHRVLSESQHAASSAGEQ